jgi:S-adenosylmethionine decarboxylase
MNVGTEWLVDAEGCSADLLRDVEAVRSVCEEVVADLELRVVGDPLWHQFPQPGGVTGLYLLTESHLACHTFPETGTATFNLYCCRPRRPFEWEARLRALLGATRVTVRMAVRGSEAARGAEAVGGSDATVFEAMLSERTSSREVSSL